MSNDYGKQHLDTSAIPDRPGWIVVVPTDPLFGGRPVYFFHLKRKAARARVRRLRGKMSNPEPRVGNVVMEPWEPGRAKP